MMRIRYPIQRASYGFSRIRWKSGSLLCRVALILSLIFLCTSCSSAQSALGSSSPSSESLPLSPSSMGNVEPEEILLSTDSVELSPGDTFLLSYSLLPADASPLDAVYASSNPSVATVDSNGIITAFSPGTAIVTVQLENGLSASLSLTVLSPDIPVSSMESNEDSITLTVWQEKHLTVTVYPEDATDKGKIWSSSDPDIAVVDSSGKIRAVSSGRCTVTAASTSNPDISCEISVTVVASSSSSQSPASSSSESSSQATTFNGDFASWNQNCDWSMMVINNNNPISDGYKPQLVSYQSIQIDQRVLPHLQEMMEAASADGAGLWLASGYRDIALQTKLYNRKVNQFLNKGYSKQDALIEAATIVAKPGTSEHHTGLAVDFNNVSDDFRDTKGYRWLTEHAAEYGFIERYPTDKQSITNVIYEPWHFRYVGVENAKAIQDSGLCLEEYVSSLS